MAAQGEARDALRQRIVRYVRQMVDGCGNAACGNEGACRVAGLSRPEALRRALAMAQETPPPPFCPPPPPQPDRGPGLSLGAVRGLLASAAAAGGDRRPLVRALGAAFGSGEVLDVSFLREGAAGEVSRESSGVDLDALDAAYQELAAAGDEVTAVLMGAMGRLLANLAYWVPPPSCGLWELRRLVVLLDCPHWIDPEWHATFERLLRVVLNLHEVHQRRLVAWWSRRSPGRLGALVDKLQMFTTVRWFQDDHRDEVISSTRVLALVHRAAGDALPFDAFYNDSINSERDARSDYIAWLEGKFSFCAYPFLLDAGFKSRLLREDSRLQQARQMRAAVLMAGARDAYLAISVDRHNLIETTLTELRENAHSLRKPLRVKFRGEDGVDEGGVKKEFFQLVVRELFPDPELSDHGFDLWTYDADTRLFYFNRDSFSSNVEFELLGTVIGLAIYNGVILDVRFPRVVYQKLCGVQPSFDDFCAAFPALGGGFRALLAMAPGDVEGAFPTTTFSLEYEAFGAVKTVELCPGGAARRLDAGSRQEYVNQYADYVLNASVEPKFRAFRAGFQRVVGSGGGERGDVFSMLRPEELELLVVGSPELDFAALEETCRYDGGYNPQSATVRHFWEVVHGLGVDEQKRLLAFATGSDRVPLGGLGELRFVIARHGPDSPRLPTAHTCFNTLLLPDYLDRDKLERLLKIAIRNSEGFGML